jgi:hypothetical protein
VPSGDLTVNWRTTHPLGAEERGAWDALIRDFTGALLHPEAALLLPPVHPVPDGVRLAEVLALDDDAHNAPPDFCLTSVYLASL